MTFTLDRLDAENRQLIAQREKLVGLLERLLQWDHLATAADGHYWRGEIQLALTNARRLAPPPGVICGLCGDAIEANERTQLGAGTAAHERCVLAEAGA